MAQVFGTHNFDYVNPASPAHVLATASGLGAAGSSFAVTWPGRLKGDPA